ncbi:MAG: radical SAM protein [Clostridia bacterium]|nr:radical SAM protein [Clostridia bacterium]
MSAPIFRAFGISRLRMASDGVGVTTLVCGYGCPLRCRYCLNPQSWAAGTPTRDYTPEGLYRILKIDDLYFRATGGGVTFGGGEPLLYADFLPAFRAVCGPDWTINLETSLAVDRSAVELAAEAVDIFIVDIKAGDDAAYRAYTGQGSERVRDNLGWLLDRVGPARIIARVPTIPGYADDAAADAAADCLRAMGVTQLDRFTYRLPSKSTGKELP